MINNPVITWFGGRFYELHPLLQQLHQHGGSLTGEVVVRRPVGVAGVFGKVIARKMGIPIDSEPQPFVVSISHQADGLHWDRCFNHKQKMSSLFYPVGTIKDGYWMETTGKLGFHLSVDIKDGGWYWRCEKIIFNGLSLPLWLFPRVDAYKTIVNGRYKFHVAILLPFMGEVLSYSGLLSLASKQIDV